jgi:hypothetical protein
MGLDLTTLDDDQMADLGHAYVQELHRRADALPASAVRRALRAALAVAHAALNTVREIAAGPIIKPQSGGGPKE